MTRRALVVGASGIVGGALARHLVQQGWEVHGLARRAPTGVAGMKPIAADLMDPQALRDALVAVKPTDVFISAWKRHPTEAENIKVNAAMVRHVLDAATRGDSVRHVGLVTGLKHYLGPFEAYGKGQLPPTPFREDQPRLAVENFYYAQEDEVFAAAKRAGFGWSIHRPHTIIGRAVGNAMNMGVTLAVYATICRATGQPFRFPGSAMQWNGLTDMTDADLLARHLTWAATTDDGAQRGLQRRQRRCVSLELDVGASGALVWNYASALQRRRCAAGKAVGRRRADLGRNRPQQPADRAGSRRRGFAVAHRRRSRPPDRGRHRHVEKPQARVP